MKKFLLFIWLLIYAGVSTGFAVSTHFCMGTQRGLELGAVKSDVCDKCGMHKEESNGCCRDEVTVVKLQQDTQAAKALMPLFELPLPVLIISQHLDSPFYNFTQTAVPAVFPSPPLPGDRCVVNCVFRI